MLPKPIKRPYDSLRQNQMWYLRKGLVEDCVRRGGCCSCSCGCCEKRAAKSRSERRKGVGHCAVECGCCSSDRGFEFTAKEKQDMENELETMLNASNPSYLLTMTEAYLSEPIFSKLLGIISKGRKKIEERGRGEEQWKRIEDHS